MDSSDEDDIWKRKRKPRRRREKWSSPGGFKPGDVVEAIWPPNQHWYDAEILSTDDDGRITVHYIEDRIKKTLRTHQIRRRVDKKKSRLTHRTRAHLRQGVDGHGNTVLNCPASSSQEKVSNWLGIHQCEDEGKKADAERDDQDVAIMEKSEDEEKKADDERDDQDVAVMEKSEDEEKKADDERDDQDVAVMKKSEDEEKNDDVTVDARNETLREVNGNEKEDACKKTMDEEDTEKEIERKEIKEKEDDGKQTVRKEMMEEDIVLSSEMSEEIEWKGITSLNFINNGLFDDDSDSQDGVPDQEEEAEITINIGLASPEANSAPSEFSHCRFLCQTCGKICQNMAALKSHAKTHETKVKKYTKPKRLCPFCKKDQSRLTRHLRKMHSEEEEVQILIEGSSCEKKEIAEKLRKKGILEANKSQLPEENPKFIAERSTSTSSVVCSLCSGFYSRLNFYKHKKKCQKRTDAAVCPTAVNPKLFDSSHGNDFLNQVVSHITQDETGCIASSDPTILLIGERLYQKTKRKVGKQMGTRKSVMNNMRLLARLYKEFREQNEAPQGGVENIFQRQNFKFLESAVEEICTDDGVLKHGMKHNLFYLLRSSANIVRASQLAATDDKKAQETSFFIEILNLNQSQVFGDAAGVINYNRQEKLRMPEMQADEEEVKTLHNFIKERIASLSSPFQQQDKSTYVSLRNALCARLTLYNARRGGEPSRLRLDQWNDAVEERWIDKEALKKLPDCQLENIKSHRLLYMAGKGNHLVPVLIPQDCDRGLNIIADATIRHNVGVLEKNPYLFPNTELSEFHCVGWDTINGLCTEAGITNASLLTASKQRHRVSTKYAEMELSNKERELFFSHMGHTKAVNEGTYQYPLAIQELASVGKHLAAFDGEFNQEVTAGPERSEGIVREETMEEEDDGKEDVRKETMEEKTSVMMELIEEEDENEVSRRDMVEQNIKKTRSKKGKRSYFRWTVDQTQQVKKRFHKWISKTEGNQLPSMTEVEGFMEETSFNCSYLQMRTKILNEQKKSQKRANKIWKEFNNKN